MRRAAVTALICAIGVAAAAITSGGSVASTPVGPVPTLTIYSSIDQNFGTASDVQRGQAMALAVRGGGAGGFHVALVRLRARDPGQVSANARRASEDPMAMAYLSEFNSGDAQISIPITNEVGLLEVGATNTYVGLTRAGGRSGEPSRFYPTGVRTFVRVVPSDRLQVRATAKLIARRHAHSVFFVDDGTAIGRSQTRMLADRLRARGVRSAGHRRLSSASSVARRVVASGADAVYFGGFASSQAADLWRRVHAARPAALLVTGEDAGDAFLKQMGSGAAVRTLVVEPTLARQAYRAKARTFDRRFVRRYHRHPSEYGLYGYAAMDAVLEAIKTASRDGGRGGERHTVREKLFATRRTQSVLGRYRIDSHGDTTLARFTVRRVTSRGRLIYLRTITAG
jgi:branched-chain amino acid transport system substrate-binding protein